VASKKMKNKMKKSCHCQVIDSADSKGLRGDPEESLFYKDGI